MATAVLALDVGEKRIGVARANLVARIPEPLTTLTNDNSTKETIISLLEEYDANLIVVGLPRGVDGQDTGQTKYVTDFIASLDLPAKIIYQDEALTSVNAKEYLDSLGVPYNKEDIDARAACIILNDYLTEDGDK